MRSDRPTDPEAARFPPPPGLPDSLIPAARGASTEPAPNEIAVAILAELTPTLTSILNRLTALEQKAGAIDTGVGVAIEIATDAAGKVATLLGRTEVIADGVITLRSEFETYRAHAMNQWNRDGEKRKEEYEELRQSVTDIEQRAAVAGE